MSAVFASHGVSAAAVSAGTRGTRASSSAHGTKFVQSSKRRFASTVALYAVSEPEAETATEEPEQPAVPELSKIDAFIADQMLDEAAILAESTFPISPEELIYKAKGVLATNNGADEPERLASSFQFVAPVVGPLPKDRFLEAFAGFKIEEGFPDAKFNYYDFRVDPFDTSRVWYSARFTGTNTGPLLDGVLPATGKSVESPPQACSMTFNEAGECTQLTVGYVMDRNIGNTGGLGAVFGILYAIGYGLPFPEAQPWQKSVQYSLFQQVGGLSSEIQKFVGQLGGGR